MDYNYVVISSIKYENDIEAMLSNELLVPKEKIVLLDDEYYMEMEEYISPELDWTDYYIDAEAVAAKDFEGIVKPILLKHSLIDNEMKTMDFACGRGRIANILKDKYKKFILCDISDDALEYCKERFRSDSNIEYIKSLPQELPIDNESLNFIYSWDAMVHFNYKMLDIYISEFNRILKNNGHCFIHHSNLDGCEFGNRDNGTHVSENFSENASWRAKISKQDIVRIAKRNNFEVLEQIDIDWGGIHNLDCITILKKLK